MATTAWSDEEYARVAKALLWPPFRRAVVTIGYVSATDQLNYALDAKLKQLGPADKVEALTLADRILVANLAYEDAVLVAPEVTRVGEISRDMKAGLEQRLGVIREMRARLSALVDHPVNPKADPALNEGGGANATWTS